LGTVARCGLHFVSRHPCFFAADSVKEHSRSRFIVKKWSPVVLSLAVVACAGNLRGATTFQLAYFPSGGVVPPHVPTCAGPIAVTATDVRKVPTEAGRRFEQDKPTVDYPIQMTGDAAAFVRAAIEANLKRAGNPGPGQTASTVAVTLVRAHIEEKTYHNAEYAGDVGLDVAVYAANPSTPCWKGQVTATGTNYGKAGAPENYQETLNRALEKATFDLLAQNAFQDALCGKCASR